MKRSPMFVLLLALSAAACATAGGASAPRPPDEFRLADGTLVVCRMEATTGSNIRERVCSRVHGGSNTDPVNAAPMLQPPMNARTGN